MVELTDIRHRYGAEQVLDLPSFALGQGERCLVLGLSGSGKTTLLHILAGILEPSHGTVVVAGQDLSAVRGTARDRFRGQNIGIVFQQMHLLSTLTVRDNLLLAQYLAGTRQDRARADEVLGQLDLAEKADAYPDALSQGQRQRIALARAVMNRPRVLLADEPTASLDDVRCEQVIALLLAQAEAHDATLLVATHDQRVKPHFERQLLLEETPVA